MIDKPIKTRSVIHSIVYVDNAVLYINRTLGTDIDQLHRVFGAGGNVYICI